MWTWLLVRISILEVTPTFASFCGEGFLFAWWKLPGAILRVQAPSPHVGQQGFLLRGLWAQGCFQWLLASLEARAEAHYCNPSHSSEIKQRVDAGRVGGKYLRHWCVESHLRVGIWCGSSSTDETWNYHTRPPLVSGYS